jgi:hypothetical protein
MQRKNTMNNESTYAAPNAVAELPVDLKNIPEVLRVIDQWVCFQFRPRPGKEKPAKCPINPRTGVEASPTDPSTWGSLAEALAALNRSGSDGIGFVLTDTLGITVLDHDDCVSPDGTIQPEVLALVNSLASYTEYSPSRKGLHIWLFGTPRRTGVRFGSFEVYHGKRYITVTGNRVDGTPPTIERKDEELTKELDRLAASSSKTPTKHGVVIPHSVHRPTEAELPLLLDGDLSPVDGDHSLADYWAARFLIRVHGPDRARIDDAMCRSKLVREKWFEKRGETTYGERTIERAILDEGWLPTDDHHQRHPDGLTVVEEDARWGWGEYPEEERQKDYDVLHHHPTVPLAGGDERSDKGLCLVPQPYCDFMRTTPTVTDWIVEGFFAPGVITLLEGPLKEAGKTTLLLWIIRSITRGDLFLGRKTRRAKVLLISEQTAQTLRPMIDDVSLSDDADFQLLLRPQLRGASWLAITEELYRLCKSDRFELVIIDTLPALAGLKNEDENKSGVALEVMNALAPLTAEKVAVVATRHERKSGGRTGAAGRGSSAYAACADLVLSLRPAPGSRNHRLLDGIGRFSHAVPVDERIDWQPELGYSKVEPIEVDLVGLDAELLAALGNEEPGRSIPELSTALGKSQSTVRRCLDHLQLQGKVRFTEDSGRGRTKRYLLA